MANCCCSNGTDEPQVKAKQDCGCGEQREKGKCCGEHKPQDGQKGYDSARTGNLKSEK